MNHKTDALTPNYAAVEIRTDCNRETFPKQGLPWQKLPSDFL